MNAAIIVAAGMGRRMGPNVDKLFLPIHHHPVVAWSWKTLDQCPSIHHIILVIRPEYQNDFHQIAQSIPTSTPYSLVPGGQERQHSVWHGLQAIQPGTHLVAIHDGARPCVSVELVEATIAMAERYGAAVAAQEVTDTIKSTVDGVRIDQHLDRGTLRSVQTPQTFKVSVIERALAAAMAAGRSLTDDTAACQAIGQDVRFVISTEPNIKITHPGDLAMAEHFLKPW